MKRLTQKRSFKFVNNGKKITVACVDDHIRIRDCKDELFAPTHYYLAGKVIDKLAHYEDLEEQGLLLKLPCKVGDELYVPEATFKRVFSVYAISIGKDKENLWVRCGNGLMYLWNEEIFATKEEAEAKLKELENE